jgi:hypothetical protein
MRKSAPSTVVPMDIRPRYDEIVALTDAFCQAHLDDEYAGLARRMTGALARKRPSPLASGQLRIWACSILHALGQINFLSDTATKPCMSMGTMCSLFGVAQSTVSNKAAVIRNAIKARRFDPEWSLRSLTDRNPLIWIFNINGYTVDIRKAPREIQQIALANGLIPYLPDDKA